MTKANTKILEYKIINQFLNLCYKHPVMLLTLSVATLYCCGYSFYSGTMSVFSVPTGEFPLDTNETLFNGGLSSVIIAELLIIMATGCGLLIGLLLAINYLINFPKIKNLLEFLKRKIVNKLQTNNNTRQSEMALFASSQQVINNLQNGAVFCMVIPIIVALFIFLSGLSYFWGEHQAKDIKKNYDYSFMAIKNNQTPLKNPFKIFYVDIDGISKYMIGYIVAARGNHLAVYTESHITILSLEKYVITKSL